VRARLKKYGFWIGEARTPHEPVRFGRNHFWVGLKIIKAREISLGQQDQIIFEKIKEIRRRGQA
jgi:hypothetical protein